MRMRLIMVMGVQRSGTTALFQSFSRDLSLVSFNESKASEVFNNFMLRPEPKIRPTLLSAPGQVLLKPISETKKRTVTDLFEEFTDYDLQIVWTYRDPVNVFYSMTQMGWRRQNRVSSKFFSRDWNRRNRFLLEAISEYRSGLMLVRYEDLAANPAVFDQLCLALNIKGKYLYRPDSSVARKELSGNLIAQIDRDTNDILSELYRQRSYKPAEFEHQPVNFKSISPKEITSKQEEKQTIAAKEILPSKINNLYLWLKPEDLSDHPEGEAISDWKDAGPNNFSIVQGNSNPQYTKNSANNLPSLHFMNIPADNSSKYIEFGTSDDWRFLYDGGEFTVFVVFKPSSLTEYDWNQHLWTTILTTMNVQGRGPGLQILWAKEYLSSVVMLVPQLKTKMSAISQSVVSAICPVNLHPLGEWHILVCNHKQTVDHKNLTVYVDNQLAEIGSQNPNYKYAKNSQIDGGLILGANLSQPETPFNGQMAEVIVFSEALNNEFRLGVTRYLKKKYDIQ
ncbi:MAG: hypothetical protein FVQ83_06180 [Chloroflexi bacterium]|nr:hypothetical protein [Chloroflexota bacterium]